MQIVGIADLAGMPAARLTFGQQRLVSLARALAGNAQLLLLDEPAAGLSAGEVERLCDAIARARAKRCDRADHRAQCKTDYAHLRAHVIVMHLGEKIGDGTPEEVQNSEQVVEAYLGA